MALNLTQKSQIQLLALTEAFMTVAEGMEARASVPLIGFYVNAVPLLQKPT